MIPAQVYLTKEERAALLALSSATGKSRNRLIREAIGDLIRQSSKVRRDAVLDSAAGLWKDRDDLPEFDAMRAQWDSRYPMPPSQ